MYLGNIDARRKGYLLKIVQIMAFAIFSIIIVTECSYFIFYHTFITQTTIY